MGQQKEWVCLAKKRKVKKCGCSKVAKEGHKGRMLQGNANTMLREDKNANRKKIRMELLTIRAATFLEQPSIRITGDKQCHYFKDGSYRCYRRDRMWLPAAVRN